MEGYLLKKSNTPSLPSHRLPSQQQPQQQRSRGYNGEGNVTFNRRYFELDAFVLRWYYHKSSMRPLGCVDLRRVKMINTTNHDENEFTIYLVPTPSSPSYDFTSITLAYPHDATAEYVKA